MKISLNWLQDFVTLTTTDYEKIKAVITANTAEIETMESRGDHLANVVVGQIEKIEAHPNADALKICWVNDGNEKFKVICGGSNIREGMKVALGRIGAVVRWHGTDVVKLEKAKIRGEESFGMICASDEIGLAELFPKKAEKEIVDLSHLQAPLGTPLAAALGLDDVVIHVDNHAINNRADLFSHKGFAREFVANGLAKWKKFSTAFKGRANNTPAPVDIHIQDKKAFSRYCAVYITGVEIAESPNWMKERLSAVGIRPINNIVDITNYVMMELGMPLHAFDADHLIGKKNVMRLSKKGEKVITLDEKERELPVDTVVLAQDNEIFDLCGIMGGLQSGIHAKTAKLWLHAPVYDGVLIRRASHALGHSSDASVIYEKGVSNEVAMEGLTRAAQLIVELCPKAHVASEVMDIKNYKEAPTKINLRLIQLERLLGVKVTTTKVEQILKNLGFKLAKKKGGVVATVPAWRNDVKLEADLIEEVARIYGYDNIPFTTPVADLTPTPTNQRRELEKTIKDQLVGMGFNEIVTFAFLGPELLKKCGLAPNSTTIEIENPISSDVSLMRQSLLPRLLETVEQAWRHEEKFRLFELSKTYFKKGDGVEEKTTLVMATAGENFRILQGVVEAVSLSVMPTRVEASNPNAQHPGRCAVLTARGKTVGSLYEVHPQVLKAFDIKSRVVVAEVDLEIIHAMKLERWSKFKELPRFPSVKLDVSIAIAARELAAKYFDLIAKTDKTLIEHIDLIDEYSGEKLTADRRGLTYSITYRATDRTLTEEEVNKIHAQVIQNLKNSGATIRL